ncbi:hypothetical protein [Brevibacillus formosus]|nr:hypothetical protein [Brevibacillus formosus]
MVDNILTLAWPTTGTTISGEFGEYRSPSEPNHKGIDISVYQEHVYAAANGTVMSSGVYRVR